MLGGGGVLGGGGGGSRGEDDGDRGLAVTEVLASILIL